MAIRMIPNSRLGQEAVVLKADTGLKEGKPEKAGEAVTIKESGKVSEGGTAGKGGGLAVAESTGLSRETVRVGQARQAADIGQVAETGKDRKAGGGIVRRRNLDQYIPEEKAESLGHYQAAPDENWKSKIQFDRPDQPSEEKGKGEQAKDSPTEESAVKGGDNQAEGAGGQSRGLQKLKLKRKQLKEQIKAETDPKKTGELKRKLAKVEKELTGTGGLGF